MKHKIRKNIIYSVSGEFISKVPLYIAEVLLLKNLDVVTYGQWTSLQIYFRFLPYLHAGALSSYNKQFPILIGEGKDQSAYALDRTVISFIKNIIIILTMLTALAVSSVFFIDSKYLHWYDYLSLGLIAIFSQIYYYQQAKYKNIKRFKKFTFGLLIYSSSFALLCYLLIGKLLLSGVLIGLCLSYLLAILYYREKTFLASGDTLPSITEVLNYGRLPYILTLSNYLYQVTDRLTLVFFTNLALMGKYGFAYISSQVVLILSNSVGRVISPYILTSIGMQESDKASLLTLKTMALLSVTVSMLLALYCITGPVLINRFFPEYLDTADAIFFFIIGIYFFSIGQSSISLLMGKHKEKIIIRLQLMLSLMLFLCLVYVLSVEHQLLYVSIVISMIQFVYFLSIFSVFYTTAFGHSGRKQVFSAIFRWVIIFFLPVAGLLIYVVTGNIQFHVMISFREISEHTVMLVLFPVIGLLAGGFLFKNEFNSIRTLKSIK